MKTYSQAEYAREFESQIAAARKAADLRATAEREAETLRRKQISAIGREYGILQAANEAIRDDISVETFRNDSVIRSLEAERDALASAVNSGTKAPVGRNALLNGIPAKNDRLLDSYLEAAEAGDPVRKGKALHALRDSQKSEPPAHLKKLTDAARKSGLDHGGGILPGE